MIQPNDAAMTFPFLSYEHDLKNIKMNRGQIIEEKN